MLYCVLIKIIYLLKSFMYFKAAVYKLKKANSEIKSDIKFIGKNYISIGGRVKIGEGFVCRTTEDGFSKIIVQKNAEFIVGDNSGVTNVSIQCFDRITIGNNVNIGNGTVIFDTNFHSLDWEIRSDRSKDIKSAITSPVIIEDYVFVGARCIIGKGVRIGEKSIIAAGSVVVKDVPPCQLWGGNPARFIKKL